MTNKLILYAEDEEDDVFFFQRAFTEAGILSPLVIVPDGIVAIDYISGAGAYSNRVEHPLPCLALLDLNMPKKSGLDVLKWIRTQPTVCALPVIMLTSSTQDADIQNAYSYGANGFLVKPGRPSELLMMVKAIRDFWLIHNRSVQDPINCSAENNLLNEMSTGQVLSGPCRKA